MPDPKDKGPKREIDRIRESAGLMSINVSGDDSEITGMLTLGDSDIALVLSYIRQAWGNQATPVTESDVSRLREHQASR